MLPSPVTGARRTVPKVVTVAITNHPFRGAGRLTLTKFLQNF